jgi:hypothetical protein
MMFYFKIQELEQSETLCRVNVWHKVQGEL